MGWLGFEPSASHMLSEALPLWAIPLNALALLLFFIEYIAICTHMHVACQF